MINPFDLEKRRELLFATEPAGQVARALEILNGLPNLLAVRTVKDSAMEIRYNLRDYTLEDLERALEQEGFHLDHSFLHNVGRNVIYYCEDTTRHNMEIPDHVTKKNEKGVFVEKHGQHLHKEHVGIPPDSREYE
ncbi:MAG: hypothetical protein A3K00_02085 [Gallionellales bacterium RIFOXYD2_FULL_52_7]|nr:MAG: hypothetical protein A3K00_02085 [Gallionellales bacterium RIFOXYD2_FULL_52_7]